jgi:hypothetical protein
MGLRNHSVTGRKILPFPRGGGWGILKKYSNLPNPSLERRGLNSSLKGYGIAVDASLFPP